MTTTTATPTKIRKYDTWGARVDGTVRIGDTIHIVARNGKEWDAQVSEIVWTGNATTIVCTGSAPRADRAPRRTYREPYSCEACQDVEDMGDARGCERHRGNPRN